MKDNLLPVDVTISRITQCDLNLLILRSVHNFISIKFSLNKFNFLNINSKFASILVLTHDLRIFLWRLQWGLQYFIN